MARRQASPDNMNKKEESSLQVVPLTKSIDGNGECSNDDHTSVPVGHWKDSLWDIFRHGYFHCSTLHACCCTSVGAGQVITRLNLTYLGQPGNLAATTGAFTKLLYIFCAFWVTRAFLLIMIAINDPNIDSKEWIEPPTFYYAFVAIDDVLVYGYWAFTALVLYNLRSQVRSKYSIPAESENFPAKCEDACCSCVCPCLVVGQMMRHTADYNAHESVCCTETGLPHYVPAIV